MIRLNFLMLRAGNPDLLARFYSQFGLEFIKEQHGKSPEHYAGNVDGLTMEIYPLENPAENTIATRLGFAVESIDQLLSQIEDARIVSKPKSSAWGKRAVLMDPEGHKVELLESR